MEQWELVARESIRDLVARYNANGDTGRFPQVLELFADDAVMQTGLPDAPGGVRTFRGIDEIATIFTGTKEAWTGAAADRGAPPFVRHCVATHQIDLVDETHAKGRCYFFVLMAHGLDHWGRYMDEYELRGDRWLFTHRRVTIDARIDDAVGGGGTKADG